MKVVVVVDAAVALALRAACFDMASAKCLASAALAPFFILLGHNEILSLGLP
jgi:hypothetical protein